MNPGKEDNITELLHKAGQSVPHKESTAAFAGILQAIAQREHDPVISFRQLSRTGIALLLIIIGNIVLLRSFSGSEDKTGPQHTATVQASYLQPDLNLYP